MKRSSASGPTFGRSAGSTMIADAPSSRAHACAWLNPSFNPPLDWRSGVAPSDSAMRSADASGLTTTTDAIEATSRAAQIVRASIPVTSASRSLRVERPAERDFEPASIDQIGITASDATPPIAHG